MKKIKNVKKLYNKKYRDEFNKFLSVIDDEYYKLLFNTLFWSGLRISELRALTKKDIIGNYLNFQKKKNL